MSGFLYLATNPVMPGLTKIGFTESVLGERFASLQTTGVPLPFELYAALRVEDVRVCENAIHGALAQERLAENREFFRVGAKDALARVLPLLLAHTSDEQSNAQAQPAQFSDLDEAERDVLVAYAMAPSVQRPHDWQWLNRMFGMAELDARHYFHTLKTKGYLREVRGIGGAILYDLAPRGVACARIAREEPEFIAKYGDKGVYFRDLSE